MLTRLINELHGAVIAASSKINLDGENLAYHIISRYRYDTDNIGIVSMLIY